MAGPRQFTRKLYINLVLEAEHKGKKNSSTIKKADRKWRSWSKDTQNLFVQLMRRLERQHTEEVEATTETEEAQALYDDQQRHGLVERKDSIRALTTAGYILENTRQQYLNTAEQLANFFTAQDCPVSIIEFMNADVDLAREKLRVARLLLDDNRDRDHHEFESDDEDEQDKVLWERSSHQEGEESWQPMKTLFDLYRNTQHGWFSIEELEPSTVDAPKFWQSPLLVHGSASALVTLFLAADKEETPSTSDNLTITDRLIRKDVDLYEFWSDAAFWDGDIRDIKNRVPFELSCHQAVNNITANGRLVFASLRHASVDINVMRLVTYCELCPNGNGGSLIIEYRNRRKPIPEPFLWYIFLNLVSCGLIMERGALNEPQEGWKTIVHRDIKPDNIFFDTPDPDVFPDYPAPKLGDFGLALRTYPGDTANPDIYCFETGTAGFIPPECQMFADRTTARAMDRYELSTATNVSSIGLAMRSFMTCTLAPKQPDYTVDTPVYYSEAELQDLRDCYSKELIDLVDSCLALRPPERARLDDLIEAINGRLGVGETVDVGEGDDNYTIERALYRRPAQTAAEKESTLEQKSSNKDDPKGSKVNYVNADKRFNHGAIITQSLWSTPVVSQIGRHYS